MGALGLSKPYFAMLLRILWYWSTTKQVCIINVELCSATTSWAFEPATETVHFKIGKLLFTRLKHNFQLTFELGFATSFISVKSYSILKSTILWSKVSVLQSLSNCKKGFGIKMLGVLYSVTNYGFTWQLFQLFSKWIGEKWIPQF